MTRTATLRITTTDPTDEDFRNTVADMTERADLLTHSAVDAWVSIHTEPEGESEHPERDALLALADKWRAPGSRIADECADELVRLLATLSL